MTDTDDNPAPKKSSHPFRRAVLRGLGVVLPPLLTLVILLWVFGTIDSYVLEPFRLAARWTIVSVIEEKYDRDDVAKFREANSTDFQDERIEEGGATSAEIENVRHVRLPSGEWIPLSVYEVVIRDPGDDRLASAKHFYNRYAELKYLKPWLVVVVFVLGFVLVLYVVGKVLAVGIGRWMWNLVEALINRLPIIRNVYSSVKQVTDFVFSEREIEFTRVVAVEYPRKNMWSIGFVTGDSMLEIRSAANEPVVSVLVPTTPMPATGFTITALKSETIELDITIDQAIQFIVSCGVVVPPHQQYSNGVAGEIIRRIEKQKNKNGSAITGKNGVQPALTAGAAASKETDDTADESSSVDSVK